MEKINKILKNYQIQLNSLKVNTISKPNLISISLNEIKDISSAFRKLL